MREDDFKILRSEKVFERLQVDKCKGAFEK